MATILSFVRKQGHISGRRPGETTGTILFFTGVRYERDRLPAAPRGGDQGGPRGKASTRPV